MKARKGHVLAALAFGLLPLVAVARRCGQTVENVGICMMPVGLRCQRTAIDVCDGRAQRRRVRWRRRRQLCTGHWHRSLLWP
jgi:hypothetical protein